MRDQLAIDFSPRVSGKFLTAAQCILNQSCEFRRRGSAKLHRDCRIIHEGVVLLPHPEFFDRRSEWRLAHDEGSSHAVAEALHQGTAQYRESSGQIGEWQRIKFRTPACSIRSGRPSWSITRKWKRRFPIVCPFQKPSNNAL